MTAFWSGYITLLTLGTIAALFVLIFATRKGERTEADNKTTGHEYDGIQEYDNPLPKWWFMLFLGTLFFGLGYLALYPGLGNWKGVLPGYEDGWTQVKQWQKEEDHAQEQYGPIFARFAAMPITEVAKDPQALKIGNRLFANHCALCHGSDAKGSFGFPNLTDGDWRWGGDPAAIETTIKFGRTGMMPSWVAVINEDGVKNVASYVRHDLAKLPITEGDTADREAGKQIFATTCTACHGPTGEGLAMLGAPNLTHPSGWIYGSSLRQLEQTIRTGRTGHMPAQEPFIGSDKAHLLAAYVYSLSQKNP